MSGIQRCISPRKEISGILGFSYMPEYYSQICFVMDSGLINLIKATSANVYGIACAAQYSHARTIVLDSGRIAAELGWLLRQNINHRLMALVC